MKTLLRLFTLIAIASCTSRAAESVAKQFLRYMYGGDGIQISNICYPSDDLWMLAGTKNTNALAAIGDLKLVSKATGVTSGLFGHDLYFIETREGKVDSSFNLDAVYFMHRQLVLRFIYAALSQNQRMMRDSATDADKVKIDGPKDAPPPGDMDVYEPIVAQLPVVRCSKPAEDARTKTVSYRVPLGEEALLLTLVKDGSGWKVDSSKSIRVSLEFFYRTN